MSSTTAIQTTAAIRRSNRRKILTELFREKVVSRAGLVASIGITGTGISRIIRELIEAGLVEEGSQRPRCGLPGRREIELAISGAVAHVIGISLHVNSRSIVLADVLGKVKDRVDLDISFTEDPNQAIDRIGRLVLELIDRNQLQREHVLGIALALAGRVDPGNGMLIESRIYDWRELPIRDLLQARTGIPVAIENLNNAINIAESKFGQSREFQNVLLVRVGTGYVGASLMLDGRLIRGRHSAAGLINHVPLNANRILCECGRRGCINTVASGFGILARSENSSHVAFSPKDFSAGNDRILAIVQSAEQGDPEARRLLSEGGAALGLYLAQLAEAVCPEAIVIAGRVARSEPYTEGLLNAWGEYASSEHKECTRILRTFKSVVEASTELAIEQFLLSEALDIEPLKRIFDSPGIHAA